MVSNADQVLMVHLKANPELLSEWEQYQKLKVDPRTTRIGKILRRYSLDELPQLWSVLIGDMSLVGPRPIIVDEVEKYGDSFEFYKRVKPGITGLWQVSGRNNTDYADRVSLDEYYVRNWSFWLDINILARTPLSVIRRDGAY
jgi:lipopolysaccharide/colanic/teichoic acid biosynthesis glycosyltransferase